jgi:uncharacterized protein HemX
MADRFTEDDGANRTTVIETRSGGSGLMIGILLLIVLVAGIAYFLFAQNRNDTVRTDAVVGAAQQVGDAAKDAGKSVGDAANRAAPAQ